MTREIEITHEPVGDDDHEKAYISVSDQAAELLDRIKAGERIESGSVPPGPSEELMKAGLIETHALVWETRVCYVPAGLDPRREAIAEVFRHYTWDESETEKAIDEIVATLS